MQFKNDEELFKKIDELINSWCERRALGALRFILNAYPLHNNLTDGWFALLNALKDIRNIEEECLIEEETEIVRDMIQSVEKALHNR